MDQEALRTLRGLFGGGRLAPPNLAAPDENCPLPAPIVKALCSGQGPRDIQGELMSPWHQTLRPLSPTPGAEAVPVPAG